MELNHLEIESHFDGKLKIAFLNNPDSYNALNRNMLVEIKDFVKACNEDDTVRCVAISGRGPAFCAGQNLKEALSLKSELNDDYFVQRMVVEYYNPMVKEITQAKKPVVALVNGAAVGAGAMLALICDFAIATESSYFSQGFVNIGLIPDTAGTYYLPKLLGRPLANYLAFTGKKLSATEAKTLGLVPEVFGDEDFQKEALAILEHLSNLPTKAIGLTKKAFNKSYDNTLEEQLDLEGIYQQKAAFSKDFMEGVSAFLEKRKPNYTGK